MARYFFDLWDGDRNVVTEAVPLDAAFVPNPDHRPGFSTRVIDGNSGVDIAEAPFNLPHVAGALYVSLRPATKKLRASSGPRSTSPKHASSSAYPYRGTY